ncbi:LOB domain-containing protein 33 [Perilla frutescens var. frutescens]|nr:LOB domain-containing protein 33 [Perilla frutescens var. frutescens]
MAGAGSSCGACKFLRRRCIPGCTFAPYFSYVQAAVHFAAAHRVFGASNVSKMLLRLPLQNRGDAAAMICYEAIARVHDPVYGCVAHIFSLQHQVAMLKEEIESIEMQMANFHSFASDHEQSLCVLLDADASVDINQACCSHIELQRPQIEHDLCFQSSNLEKMLQELRGDYCYL